MNERITELMERAGFDPAGIERMGVMPQAQKFVELIVRDCVGIVSTRKIQAINDSWSVDEALSMAEVDLEEYFGVTGELE